MGIKNSSRKLLAAILLNALLLCLALPLSISAQNTRALKQYLMFKVTVRGIGETDEHLKWSIDRTYESAGLVELDASRSPIITQGLSADDIKLEIYNAMKGGRWANYKMPLKITINDSLISTTVDHCPSPTGGYYETTVITKKWIGTGVVSAAAAAGIKLSFDNEPSYNLSLPLFAVPMGPNTVRYTEETEITHKPTEKIDSLQNIASFKIPRVSGILSDSAIHHSKDRPLDVLSAGESFDSGDLTPDEPVIAAIEASREGVTVHVTYRFKTGPFTSISGK